MEKVWKSTLGGSLIDLRRVDALLIEPDRHPYAPPNEPQPPNAGEHAGWGVVALIGSTRYWLYRNDNTSWIGEQQARRIGATLAVEAESGRSGESGWMVDPRGIGGYQIPEPIRWPHHV